MGRDHTVIYLQNTEEHFQLYQSIRNIGNIGGCFLRYFKKTSAAQKYFAQECAPNVLFYRKCVFESYLCPTACMF